MKKSRLKEIIREELERKFYNDRKSWETDINKLQATDDDRNWVKYGDVIIALWKEGGGGWISIDALEGKYSNLTELDKGSIKLKKDTSDQDIKKFTDKGFDVELNESEQIEINGYQFESEADGNDIYYHVRVGPKDLENTSAISDNAKEALSIFRKKLEDQGFKVEYLGRDKGYSTIKATKNITENDKFDVTARNLIHVNKELKQLAKAYDKAEPETKKSLESIIRKKYKIKKELEAVKDQLDEGGTDPINPTNKDKINNSYVIKDEDGYFTIDIKRAYKYLKQFQTPEINVKYFIKDDEGWGEFEQYLENIEQKSDAELEKDMRDEMSYYFFSKPDEI